MGSNGPAWGRRQVDVRLAFDEWRARQRAADAAAVRYWNLHLEMRGPQRVALTLGQAINGGYTHLRLQCRSCRQTGFIALAEIRRPADEPFWKMEDRFACRVCRQDRPFPSRARIERITRSARAWGWGDV